MRKRFVRPGGRRTRWPCSSDSTDGRHAPRLRDSSPSPRASSDRRCATSVRSEEHTSELQSHSDLVCRLLLEKKKDKANYSRANTYNIYDNYTPQLVYEHISMLA